MADKIELIGIYKEYKQNKPVIEDLNLEIAAGSFTVLLGPSGCGKSTILRMIAGLEKQTHGHILIDGINTKDVAPGDRSIAMVFQNYALYPTMTVYENMEFGLKNMKVSKAEREQRISEIADTVGLAEYLDRKPGTLSGGQRQRVALARAIVKKPQVFLMDEPLSNLDAKLRNQLRTELIELHRRLGTTFVYVTHDQIEAMSMGTEIILLKDGRIIQKAAPTELYQSPANVFAAQFIGSPPMNVLDIMTAGTPLRHIRHGTRYVGFRPEHAAFGDSAPAGERDIVIEGNIVARELLGSEQLYTVLTAFGHLRVKLYGDRPVDYGPARIVIPGEKLCCFSEDQCRMPIGLKAGDCAV